MSEPYPVLGKDNANSLRKGDMVYLDFSGHTGMHEWNTGKPELAEPFNRLSEGWYTLLQDPDTKEQFSGPDNPGFMIGNQSGTVVLGYAWFSRYRKVEDSQ